MNTNKVFVGNLPYSMNETALRDFFIQAGDFKEEDITEVIILKEKPQERDMGRPPRSRGIGFVAFATPELMQQALDTMNQKEVEYQMKGEDMKRPIYVSEARPPQERN